MIKFNTILFCVFQIAASCSEAEKSNIADSSNVERGSDTNELYNFQTDSLHKSSDTKGTSDSILSISQEIILFIKNKSFENLSNRVHPERGLRYIPYGYIDVKNSRNYFQKDVQKFFMDSTIYKWGNYDGSGDEIVLSNSGYYKKFIYDVDFAKAPNVAVDSILGLGNSLINIKKVYPESHFVEYHFTGFDKQYNGMDWRSLRLIFEVYKGKLYLIGISHDQWTS